jgi:uncharacterized delta-60 repeat protein
MTTIEEEVMPLTFTRQRISILALSILMGAPSYAAAQAGSLDPTFGKNGVVAISRQAVRSVAIQSDGKIVLGCFGETNSQLFDTLIRLNSNGSLDTTFGSGGIANLTPPASESAPLGFFGMAIQSNGKIVAAAVTQALQNGVYSNFVQVARVETNGTLDTSFGSGGFTTTDAIASTPYDVSGPQAAVLALDGNGSILIASSYSNVMARFTSSGQLDTTFGSEGIVNLANPGQNLTAAPTQIAIQKNGKILVASGSVTPNPLAQAGTISRYNSNGSLDKTFEEAGTTASVASASALSLESDGEIVVAGSLTSKLNAPPASNNLGFGVVRYSASGVIDKTFGNGGVAIANFGTNAPLSGAFAVAIASNDKILAGGAAAQGALNLNFDSAFGLARFTSSGALDKSFGMGGLVTTTLVSGSSGVYSYVTGLAVQSDGKIVAAGNTSVDQGFGTGTGIYVARYLAQ